MRFEADSQQARQDTDVCLVVAPAAPPTSYLRVPLRWVQSSTYALYDDETHGMIRRSYTPTKQRYIQRHFCGFCSTPLSLWSEKTRDDAEYLCITIGTLNRDGLDVLEDMGLLDEDSDKGEGSDMIENKTSRPWYEKIADINGYGKRKRGIGQDDGWSVDWEIIEWNSDDASPVDSQEESERPLAKRPRSQQTLELQQN